MKLKIPKTLIIGWAKWAIEKVDHPLVWEGKEIGGYCSANRKLIEIHDEYAAGDKDILYRMTEEIVHGINDFLDIDDESDSAHHILRQWVSAFFMFAKNNIAFMRHVLDFLEEC